ncbi:MAG: Y-family polymerase [Candidatus Saccharibacteria bacterium]|nr:Y-family polymerase [Candidatus Saccharibacteria bacterium]
MFALIDCNNFFVSCERLFQPDLNGRPVVVLSSNDGCAVARSNEAKALGIPMGAPAFKYRDMFKQHQVKQFSANFELYGDISDRLTRLLTTVTSQIELYSVDESFLDLTEMNITDYRAWGDQLRQRIWREIGVPVSIGIAPTKTLAKLASERAKKDRGLDGVLSLAKLPDWLIDPQLAAVPIESIWGVGWRLGPKLRAIGVHTALDLKQLPRSRATQMMGVHGRQMVCELNGMSCLPLEREHKVRQSVMHGRMFGEDTTDFSVIEAAIASLTARATHRLRQDGLLAQRACLSLSGNRHKPGYKRHELWFTFSTPTADTGLITAQIIAELDKTYNRAEQCHRANVLLFDLVPQDSVQADLLGYVDLQQNTRSQSRLAAVDQIAARFGKARIGYAAEKLSQAWQPKRQLRSPRYTTNWDELPQARLSPG